MACAFAKTFRNDLLNHLNSTMPSKDQKIRVLTASVISNFMKNHTYQRIEILNCHEQLVWRDASAQLLWVKDVVFLKNLKCEKQTIWSDQITSSMERSANRVAIKSQRQKAVFATIPILGLELASKFSYKFLTSALKSLNSLKPKTESYSIW